MNKQIISIYLETNFKDKAPSAKKLKKEQPRIFNAIYDYTDYMPKNASLSERSYNLKANLSKRPKCPSCNKLMKYSSYKNGYGSCVKCKGK